MTGSVLGALHLLVVGGTLLATGARGESQAFLVAFADFPLVSLMRVIPGGSYVLYGSRTAYVLFFTIAGTLMYAAAGWFAVGWLYRIRVGAGRHPL
jgi:hypothetical protein